MIKVVLINGRPSSGKTTFEKICSEKCDYFSHTQGFRPNYYLHINIISTIDFIKKIAYDCGWDGTKTLENRKFLSKLKDLLTEWNDVPYKKIIEHINSLPRESDWIVFVDCREPKEIQRLKEALNATTVLIRRPGDETIETSNHADSDVFNYNYDLTIFNNSDIIDLSKIAEDFIEYMRGAPHYEC